MGIKTMRIAFSCTCQPNMKAVRPHRVIARMNASLRTILKRRRKEERKLIEIPFEDFLFPYRFDESSHSLTKQGSIVTPVRTNVVNGEILGRTSWSNV